MFYIQSFIKVVWYIFFQIQSSMCVDWSIPGHMCKGEGGGANYFQMWVIVAVYEGTYLGQVATQVE